MHGDVTNGPKREGPWSVFSGKLRFWRRFSLTTQFLTVATFIVCASMAILGHWLVSQIEAGQIRSRAESGALYMEGFLAPHVQELNDTSQLSETHQRQLDELLIGTDLAGRVEGIRIWRRDGTVIYSTDKSLMGRRLPSADIDRAFTGNIVAQLEKMPDDEDQAKRFFSYPLLEVYAPIYRTGSHEVVAVGEFYEEAGMFISQLDRARHRTWGIVGATTAAIMALLFLIVRRASYVIDAQRTTLRNQLTNARALAVQNKRLRRAADRARMDASKSNENLLNRIGSDLHDGPVQLLSLLILRLGSTSVSTDQKSRQTDTNTAELDPSRLANQVLAELRELSTGLVLPEIENLSLEAALRIAVERHEYATGSVVVDATYSGLPQRVAHPLKICLYRVIQEGLNNAFRHAAAREQRVAASADESAITVVVSDAGAGAEQATTTGRRHPLGLQGIRNRVEAFGGSVQIRPRHGSGTELIVVVPLEINRA